VVAAGSIKHDDFVRQVEARLGGFRPKAESTLPQYANYVGGDYREDRGLMDAQILLGFEGRAYHVRDFYTSQLLSMILGGGMSSRLFQEVREKRGLCYSVYAFHWGFSDTGVFGVHAATGKDDIARLVPVILDELQRAGEKILPEELNRARAQYRAGLLMSQESAASRASQIARQLMLYGRPIPMQELVERLSAITTERLRDLAERLFATKPTVAAIGPVGALPAFETIRESLGGPTPSVRRLAG
jgi:predicted Zn-dependent peptidase